MNPPYQQQGPCCEQKTRPYYRNAADHRCSEAGISALCGPDNSCIGCSKKLMELVDTDLSYWQYRIDRGIPPSFDELNRFGKMCKNIRRALMRNGRIPA